jgi:aryl-alcohol dehydrogenase-like predicted oxidoreductase
MIYRSLGRTGMQVSQVCFGTWTFGSSWGCDQEQSHLLLNRVLESGVNFIDTADSYAAGQSEIILGQYITPAMRSKLILATKCHFLLDDTDPNGWGNSRRHIIESCEASLKRLNTDWIDLYQIHRPDPRVPIDETLRALDDLVRQGKIRHIGCSSFGAWQACEAHYVAKNLGLSGFVTEQPPYNLLDRSIERELLPYCKTYDYGVITWSPLAFGLLSGRYCLDQNAKGRANEESFDEKYSQSTFDVIKQLDQLAKKYDLSLLEMSLAWVVSNPSITCPIIGVSKLEQLDACMKAAQMELDAEIMTEIDKIVPPCSTVEDFYARWSNFGPNARPNS